MTTNIRQALIDAAAWQQHAARKWHVAQTEGMREELRQELLAAAARHYAMARRFLWLAIDGEYRGEA